MTHSSLSHIWVFFPLTALAKGPLTKNILHCKTLEHDFDHSFPWKLDVISFQIFICLSSPTIWEKMGLNAMNDTGVATPSCAAYNARIFHP